MMLARKGFLGPIGDDLPSLVPIVVGLLLFFFIFSMTLSVYSSKNTLIREQTEMTSVARELKGDSLILGVDSFEKKCGDLKLKRFPYNFMAAVYDASIDIDQVVDDFAEVSSGGADPVLGTEFLKQTTLQGDKPFYCEYFRAGAKPFSASKKDYLIRFYPVAIQYPMEINGETHYLIVPGLMAMVFWE